MTNSNTCARIEDAAAAVSSLGIVGTSLAVEELRTAVRRFAPLPAPVLVTGETGTGKDVVAHAIHEASPRRRGPFVALNAAAVPVTLVATELFGHDRGAFTGATGVKLGVFEQAHGGTLFIDEIGELPLDLQAWLLRVLETGEVRRVGAQRALRVDTRVVAATHVDLEHAVHERRFRADLYWRLAVLPIRVPALREHPEDIADLADHLIDTFALTESYELRADAMQALVLHDWPGNVRELRSVLLRAIASASRTRLDASDIVRAIGPAFATRPRTHAAPVLTAALHASNGNIAAAARLVRLPRSTFRYRLRSVGRA